MLRRNPGFLLPVTDNLHKRRHRGIHTRLTVLFGHALYGKPLETPAKITDIRTADADHLRLRKGNSEKLTDFPHGNRVITHAMKQ
ncbi:hypothetical protein D3C80_1866130 [compost metagenome]